jgi:hypothetical protein
MNVTPEIKNIKVSPDKKNTHASTEIKKRDISLKKKIINDSPSKMKNTNLIAETKNTKNLLPMKTKDAKIFPVIKNTGISMKTENMMDDSANMKKSKIENIKKIPRKVKNITNKVKKKYKSNRIIIINIILILLVVLIVSISLNFIFKAPDKKSVNYGEACSDTKQCKSTYMHCYSKKCVCTDSSTLINNTCGKK